MAEKTNPFENMLEQLDAAAEIAGFDKNDYITLRYPERELTVNFPVKWMTAVFVCSPVTVFNTTLLEDPPKAGFVFIRM